eukprot:2567875-Rhodomonas_salina.1
MRELCELRELREGVAGSRAVTGWGCRPASARCQRALRLLRWHPGTHIHPRTLASPTRTSDANVFLNVFVFPVFFLLLRCFSSSWMAGTDHTNPPTPRLFALSFSRSLLRSLSDPDRGSRDGARAGCGDALPCP